MPHWSCSSALCFNNFTTRDDNGNPLKYYKLPTDSETQAEYVRFFKTTGFNWEAGYICAAHWSGGEREDPKDLPDVLLPSGHLELLKTKYERASGYVKVAKDPTSDQKLALKRAREKYNTALAVSNSGEKKKCRPAPKVREGPSSSTSHDTSSSTSTPPVPACHPAPLPTQEEELIALRQLLVEKDAKIRDLEEKLQSKSQAIDKLKIEALERQKFSYEEISQDPKKLQHLTGLTLEQFNLMMDCVRPYIASCLRYENDSRPATERTFSFETQYLIVMMICRHGLDFKFVGYLTNVCNVTTGRIYNGWVIFLATIFNLLDTRADRKYLQQKMPEIFVKTGHGSTDLVIDATEFRFDKASNFDMSALMFSHYKNTTTGKALIGISPHGMGLVFSEVYPGSISDTEITEKTNILEYVTEDHEVMSDKGFSIQDLCAIKGVSLNRPKQKDSESGGFQEPEIHRNFDITSCRIHVERFIGRVRNWRILNTTWPMNRTDLLCSTWQMICHTVNILFPPIGPSETDNP